MESLPPDIQATAWELRVGGAPRQTAALDGNILRLALAREPFQGVGSFSKFLMVISEVSRLLWFLHQEGVVHRDLKPEHILLADNAVTLIGFLPPPMLDASSSLGAAFIGTPGYAPPEQARGEELIEPKSDVFSLGAILYEAITHQTPFRGNLMAAKLATLTTDPPPIQKLSPLCPASLISLCELMLAKDPTLRPNADEVRQQLIEIAKEAAGLSLPLFSERKNVPLPSPSPVKTEPEKFSSEELLDRIFPFRPPPLKLQPFDTRAPGIAHPMSAKGRYLLEREVGQGGIGKVSRAHDQRLQRPVAIKELLHPDNEDARERFLREALLTARLQHPAIVPIYDVGVRASGEIFYSMRFISGKPLNEMAEEKPFYERLALLPHLLTVAEAIASAHAQKIIHRDLKPQNILIGEFGETVVIDWGSAKDLNEHEPQRKTTPRTPLEILAAQELAANTNKTPELTIEGSIIGTPAYMAPEQALGRRVNETADVFALGAILYHLLAGKAPVRDKDKLMQQVQDGIFEPLNEVEPKTPEELLTIVQKAMSREPERRYPTAISFAEDLRRYQRGQLINAHKYSLWDRFFKYVKQHKQAFAVGTIAFILLISGGAYSIQQIIHEKNVTQRSLHNLMLMQAREELHKNPAKSIAWIKQLPPDYPDLDKARIIASDAVRRGIPDAIEGHTGRVNHIVYHNQSLVSGSTDGTIRIWNPQTKEATKILQAKEGVVHFDISQSGHLIAGVYTSGVIRLWDVATEAVLAEFTPTVPSTFCTFSPDASLLATTGDDGTSYVWDLQTQEQREIFRSAEPTYNLQFSPDGQSLAAIVFTTKQKSEVHLYDLATQTIQSLSPSTESRFVLVKFSKSGKFVAAAGYNGALSLWDRTTGVSIQLEGHNNTIYDLAFSEDETRLASGGDDKSIRLWNTSTGALIFTYKEHTGSIRDLAFSNRGDLLASASGDKTVQLWNLETNQHRILRRHEDIVQSLAFSPDDKTLFSGGFDSLLLRWEVEPSDRRLIFQQKEPVYAVGISDDASLVAAQREGYLSLWSTKDFTETKLTPYTDLITSITFSPNNQLIAIGDHLGYITILDIKNNTIKKHKKHHDIIQKIKFIDSDKIFSASNDKTIKFWNITKQEPEIKSYKSSYLKYINELNSDYLLNNNISTFFGHSDFVTSFITTSDNKLISVSLDKKINIWDIKRNQLIKTIQADDLLYNIEISKDEKYIALVTPSSTIRVLELSSLLEGSFKPTMLEGHNDQTTKASFIGENHLLVSASADTMLRLWDAANQESSLLVGHTGSVVGLAVARNANVAVSSGLDGSVRIWWERVPETTPEFLQWLQKISSATLSDKIMP